jgi:hypothetical protein
VINYAEKEILYKESFENPRKVITISYELSKDNYKYIYEDSINKSLNVNQRACKKIYDKIFSLKSLSYLTTNLDNGIEWYNDLTERRFRKRRYYDCTLNKNISDIIQLNYNILKDGNIINLHGTIKNIETCILSIDKYLSYYDQKNDFLNELFLRIKNKNCLIIFLGYSLNEWDIIEKIYKMRNYPREVKSILLSPIFEYGITKFNLEMAYFNAFGVRPIPYIVDNEGYERLFNVLEKLSLAIDRSSPNLYDFFPEIEKK